MAKDPVNNLNVLSQNLLPTPQQVKSALPLTESVHADVKQLKKVKTSLAIKVERAA